jgi:hypothetical protein
MRVNLVTLWILLAGCSPTPDVRPKACDGRVDGVCIASRDHSYSAQYIDRQMDSALQYWNAPASALDGWAIEYTAGEVPCPTALGSGCTWWDDDVKTIVIQTLDVDCPETAQLVHEIGHVLHHDPDHSGPWWNWQAEQHRTWEIVRSPGASPGCSSSLFYVVAP